MATDYYLPGDYQSTLDLENEGALTGLAKSVLGSAPVQMLLGAMDKPGRIIRGILGGNFREALNVIPFSDTVGITNEEDNLSGRDLNRQYGLAGEENNWGNFFGGLATEILLDPLNALTLGTKSSLTALGREAAKTGLAKTAAARLAEKQAGLIGVRTPWFYDMAAGPLGLPTGSQALLTGDAGIKALNAPGELLGAVRGLVDTTAAGRAVTGAGDTAGAYLRSMFQKGAGIAPDARHTPIMGATVEPAAEAARSAVRGDILQATLPIQPAYDLLAQRGITGAQADRAVNRTLTRLMEEVTPDIYKPVSAVDEAIESELERILAPGVPNAKQALKTVRDMEIRTGGKVGDAIDPWAKDPDALTYMPRNITDATVGKNSALKGRTIDDAALPGRSLQMDDLVANSPIAALDSKPVPPGMTADQWMKQKEVLRKAEEQRLVDEAIRKRDQRFPAQEVQETATAPAFGGVTQTQQTQTNLLESLMTTQTGGEVGSAVVATPQVNQVLRVAQPAPTGLERSGKAVSLTEKSKGDKFVGTYYYVNDKASVPQGALVATNKVEALKKLGMSEDDILKELGINASDLADSGESATEFFDAFAKGEANSRIFDRLDKAMARKAKQAGYDYISLEKEPAIPGTAGAKAAQNHELVDVRGTELPASTPAPAVEAPTLSGLMAKHGKVTKPEFVKEFIAVAKQLPEAEFKQASDELMIALMDMKPSAQAKIGKAIGAVGADPLAGREAYEGIIDRIMEARTGVNTTIVDETVRAASGATDGVSAAEKALKGKTEYTAISEVSDFKGVERVTKTPQERIAARASGAEAKSAYDSLITGQYNPTTKESLEEAVANLGNLKPKELLALAKEHSIPVAGRKEKVVRTLLERIMEKRVAPTPAATPVPSAAAPSPVMIEEAISPQSWSASTEIPAGQPGSVVSTMYSAPQQATGTSTVAVSPSLEVNQGGKVVKPTHPDALSDEAIRDSARTITKTLMGITPEVQASGQYYRGGFYEAMINRVETGADRIGRHTGVLESLARNAKKFDDIRNAPGENVSLFAALRKIGNNAGDVSEVAGAEGGKIVVLDNGVKLTLLERLREKGLTSFDPATANNDMRKINKELKRIFIPKDLLPKLQLEYSGAGYTKATGAMEAIAGYTNAMRSWMTVPFAPFHVRNAQEALLQSGMMSGISRESYDKASRYLAGAITDAAEKSQLDTLAAEAGVYGAAFRNQVTEQMGKSTVSEAVKTVRPTVDQTGKTVWQNVKEFGANYSPKSVKEQGLSYINPSPSKNIFVQQGMKASTALDDTHRFAQYVELRNQGYLPEAAAKIVTDTHLDYGQLTDFEKGLRSVVPFYSFSRRNLARTAQQMENPGPLVSLLRAGGRAGAEDIVPGYISQGTAIPIPGGEDGKQRYLSGVSTPFDDELMGAVVSAAGGNLQDAGRRFLSTLSPAVKLIATMGTGRQLFTGRRLDEYNPTGVAGLLPNYAGNVLSEAVGATPLGRIMSTVNTAVGGKDDFTLLKLLSGIRTTQADPELARQMAAKDAVSRLLKRTGMVGTSETLYARPEYRGENQPAELTSLLELMQQLRQRGMAMAQARQ